ncbi:hypothetical protein V8B97DRAFT_1518617 [Scleroderma yunnanense]
MSTPIPPGSRRNPSRKSKAPTLPFIEEDSNALHVSPSYDPNAERNGQRASKNTVTPEKRKKWGSSVDTRQKIRAREADPHNGRCLLTNLDDAINVCHLIPSATNPSELMKLEYAWGVPSGHLNLDSTCNLIHLRSDWHFLFDQGKFMLIPELSDLRQLEDVTITKALAGRSQTNVNKLFKRRTFRYHLLPMPELQAPICHFGDPNDLAVHSTHYRPFATLGPLVSHVQPQYAIVNAAQKLSTKSPAELFKLPSVLKQIASHKSVDKALSRLTAVMELYSHWTKLVMPDGFVACSRPPSSSSDDGDNNDQDQDHAEEGQEESEEPEESDDDELQSTPSKKSNVGRQLHDDVASTSSSDSLDTAVDADGWCPSENTVWVEEINNWTMKCCDAAVSEGGWESSILNEDDQVLVAYTKEKPRSAPPPDSWHKWRPCWYRREGRYPSHNTAKFSSNDWALFEEDTALPVDSE